MLNILGGIAIVGIAVWVFIKFKLYTVIGAVIDGIVDSIDFTD